MKKAGIITIATLFAASAQLTAAHAAGSASGQNCNPTYGGGSNCTSYSLTVNKEVQDPNGNWVKNLSINDAHFAPGQQINYRLTVQNTSANTIGDIVVVDNFPQYINYASGVAGTYDAGARSLTFHVNNLGANQSQQFTLTTFAFDANNLPGNNNVTCVTNVVTATDNASHASAQDSAQACIEKGITAAPTVQKGAPLTKTPATGPEMAVIPFLGSTGLFGAFLKRKSSKK